LAAGVSGAAFVAAALEVDLAAAFAVPAFAVPAFDTVAFDVAAFDAVAFDAVAFDAVAFDAAAFDADFDAAAFDVATLDTGLAAALAVDRAEALDTVLAEGGGAAGIAFARWAV
jgi:hypothetical protein